MICFTVMDHDVLTANDFGGEAFLALGNIPGVADYSTSVDNFHGLKQIELPLMQQKDKCEYKPPFYLLPPPCSLYPSSSSYLHCLFAGHVDTLFLFGFRFGGRQSNFANPRAAHQ